MRVMARYTNSVFIGAFDGFSGMGPIAQALNHVLVTARALIRIKKMFQRLIDLRWIGMESFADDISMALQARNPSVDGSMELSGIDQPGCFTARRNRQDKGDSQHQY